MEHVADIQFAYSEMHKWLKQDGLMSHQIDFKSHEMTNEWNGHWFISESSWQFLLKGRKYPINRLPLSAHLEILRKLGFDVVTVLPVKRKNNYIGKEVKMKGLHFTDDDLVTSGALVQAVKRKE